MVLFGKQSSDNPVNHVLQLRQQGMSDNQIVQELQGQGVATQQIFDAMSQADLTRVASPEPDNPEAYPSNDYPSEPAPYDENFSDSGVSASVDARVQQVAEAIINEKWEEFVSEVQKIISWKDSVEGDIHKLSESVEVLQKEFTELRQGVLGKVGEYDTRMRDVSSELKAVQKVFKDVIPTFTENVAELSRITKKARVSK
jgi:hypothetical protein